MATPVEPAHGLFVCDDPVRADLALVFGHSDPAVAARRARRAVSLYHQGFVARLLFSGGGHATPDGTPEARHMADEARALGVPEEAIQCELQARTTYENVVNAVAVLRDTGRLPGVATVLLVSCPWHMRRVLLLARHVFPAPIRLLCCPHHASCTAHTWANSPECRQFVADELRLLARLAGSGKPATTDSGGPQT